MKKESWQNQLSFFVGDPTGTRTQNGNLGGFCNILFYYEVKRAYYSTSFGGLSINCKNSFMDIFSGGFWYSLMQDKYLFFGMMEVYHIQI